MDSQIFTLLIIAGIVVAVCGIAVYAIFFNEAAIVRRKLKQIPARDISRIKDDEIVKLVGRVRAIGQPLVAPFSLRKCVFYYAVVHEKRSKETKAVLEMDGSVEFYIESGHHVARIDTNKIRSYVMNDREFSSGFLNDADEHICDFLAKHGQDTADFLGMNKTLEYEEGVLEEGEMIAVLGKAKWQESDLTDVSTTNGKVLSITCFGDESVYLSDDPETLKFYS